MAINPFKTALFKSSHCSKYPQFIFICLRIFPNWIRRENYYNGESILFPTFIVCKLDDLRTQKVVKIY